MLQRNDLQLFEVKKLILLAIKNCNTYPFNLLTNPKKRFYDNFTNNESRDSDDRNDCQNDRE